MKKYRICINNDNIIEVEGDMVAFSPQENCHHIMNNSGEGDHVVAVIPNGIPIWVVVDGG